MPNEHKVFFSQQHTNTHTHTHAVISHVGTGNTSINSPKSVLIQDRISVVGKVSKASNTPKI